MLLLGVILQIKTLTFIERCKVNIQTAGKFYEFVAPLLPCAHVSVFTYMRKKDRHSNCRMCTVVMQHTQRDIR